MEGDLKSNDDQNQDLERNGSEDGRTERMNEIREKIKALEHEMEKLRETTRESWVQLRPFKVIIPADDEEDEEGEYGRFDDNLDDRETMNQEEIEQYLLACAKDASRSKQQKDIERRLGQASKKWDRLTKNETNLKNYSLIWSTTATDHHSCIDLLIQSPAV